MMIRTCRRTGRRPSGEYGRSSPNCGRPESPEDSCSTICPGGRLHHHLVVNSTGEDLEEIRRLWIYGDNVEVRRLEFNQGHTYEDLASYLTKEPREWGHPQVGERTWTPSLGLARTEPETETVPDYVTLTAPPEAVILQNEGPVRNGYGEFAWIKYMLPYQPDRRRARSKRRRRRKKE